MKPAVVKEEVSKTTAPAAETKTAAGGGGGGGAGGGGGGGSGSSGKKRNQDRGRERSRDRQGERERQRRGERSRGGSDRGPSKGAVYKPRSHPECRVYISNIPYEYRWQDLKDLFRSEGLSLDAWICVAPPVFICHVVLFHSGRGVVCGAVRR